MSLSFACYLIWSQEANGSRHAAFKEFELAVETAQAAGCLRADPHEQKGASAHLLTAIVDGFLFHHFAEHIGAGDAIGRLLAALNVLVDRALSGLEGPQSDPRPDRRPQGESVTTGTQVNRPGVGELRYHDSLGPVIVMRRRLDGRFVVRRAQDEKETVVHGRTLREQRPNSPSSAKARSRTAPVGRQAWKEIDAKAASDAPREAKWDAQAPRPSRGGGSFERNRSRH